VQLCIAERVVIGVLSKDSKSIKSFDLKNYMLFWTRVKPLNGTNSQLTKMTNQAAISESTKIRYRNHSNSN